MPLHRVFALVFVLLVCAPVAQHRGVAMAEGVADTWRDRSPHRSGVVSANGVKLHYLDWGGHGRPLLLLAGLFGSAHGFDDIAPQLARDFHVIAMTRRGHGKSDSPATGYALDVLVEDIREFLDALQLDRVHVAGVSAGGVEAALLAARYPDRVDRVVYLDSAYDHSAAFTQKWAQRLAGNPVTKTRLPFPPKSARESFATFRMWYQREVGPWSPAVEADNREMYVAPDGSVKPFPASLAMAQELIASGMASPPDYAAVKTPALAVFAISTRPDLPEDADPGLRRRADAFHRTVVMPMQREQIDRLRASVATITLVELSNTTHARFMTEKRGEVVKALTTFLKSKARGEEFS